MSYYSVFRLTQLGRWTAYLYLLCFITHRYQRFHDHLLTSFIHLVTQALGEVNVAVKDEAGRKRIIPDHYEVVVYRLLRNGLEAGDIFCRHSVRFRSFEDDLFDNQQWQNKERLMIQTGLLILLQPVQDHLTALERLLEERIQAVNHRITQNENIHFQIKSRGKRIRLHHLLQCHNSFTIAGA